MLKSHSLQPDPLIERAINEIRRAEGIKYDFNFIAETKQEMQVGAAAAAAAAAEAAAAAAAEAIAVIIIIHLNMHALCYGCYYMSTEGYDDLSEAIQSHRKSEENDDSKTVYLISFLIHEKGYTIRKLLVMLTDIAERLFNDPHTDKFHAGNLNPMRFVKIPSEGEITNEGLKAILIDADHRCADETLKWATLIKAQTGKPGWVGTGGESEHSSKIRSAAEQIKKMYSKSSKSSKASNGGKKRGNRHRINKR